MLSVRLLLSIAKIFKLDSKAQKSCRELDQKKDFEHPIKDFFWPPEVKAEEDEEVIDEEEIDEEEQEEEKVDDEMVPSEKLQVLVFICFS